MFMLRLEHLCKLESLYQKIHIIVVCHNYKSIHLKFLVAENKSFQRKSFQANKQTMSTATQLNVVYSH